MALRQYQFDALSSVIKAYDTGVTRQLLTMATGTGKTVVFANLPSLLDQKLPGQMWVIAHREELIDQAVAKIRDWNPSLLVDKEMAEHYANPLADVIVSSVASIGRKGTKRADRFDWDAVTKVVIDEAHHSTATTYQNFMELTGVLKPDSKKLLLGVTATPARGDGKALAAVYQKIVYSYPMRSAIDDGWLVDLRGYRVNTKTSLDDLKTVAGDFQQDALADAVNNPARNQLVVKSWQEKANGLQTVVFTVDIKHALDMAEMFRQFGVKAQAVWGSDPDRAEKLKQHKAEEITVLCNCGVLIEGYDDWRIKCIVDAAPTKSSSRYTQKVGRGTRLQEGTGNLLVAMEGWTAFDGPLKTDCIVIDVCDATTKHKLQTVPSLMGLDSNLDLNGQLAAKSAAAIEKAQEENPHIDLRNLRDMTQLQAYIESVNLFDIDFPEEVKQNSQLMWYPTADNGYTVMLPNHERAVIKQNMLDEWEITAVIKGQKFRGSRPTFDEAVKAADAVIEKYAPMDLKILRREEPWHADKATPPQKGLLRKYYKGRELPYCICKVESALPLCPTCKAKTDMTKGHAGKLISRVIAGKMPAATA
jgi:superfamily II DNA or RNA helicase